MDQNTAAGGAIGERRIAGLYSYHSGVFRSVSTESENLPEVLITEIEVAFEQKS